MAPIAARRPVLSTKRQAASTFGAIEPGCEAVTAKLLPAWCGRSLVPSPGGQRVHTPADIGQEQETIGVDALGEKRRRMILVDDGLDTAQPALGGHRDRHAAAARANDDDTGSQQKPDRADLADPLRRRARARRGASRRRPA